MEWKEQPKAFKIYLYSMLAIVFLLGPNSTAKCDTLQYQEAKAISSNIMAACLKPKHFLGR